MTIEEPQQFLQLRRLKITGERSFSGKSICAIENNIRLVRSAEEVDAQLK